MKPIIILLARLSNGILLDNNIFSVVFCGVYAEFYQSTYFGSSGSDYGLSIAKNSARNLLVFSGFTNSNDFPLINQLANQYLNASTQNGFVTVIDTTSSKKWFEFNIKIILQCQHL